ncbi:MAG: DUF11 domain-containing protein, partial [Planctomycetota bacterium]
EGDEVDPSSANDTDDEQTTVTAVADLALSKIDKPDPVRAGGTIIYELDVTNLGPSSATGITLTDTLAPDVISLDINGDPAGSTVVGCETEALEPGEELRFTIVALIDESVSEGTNLVNLAVVAGDEPDPDTGNNIAQASTTVGPPVDETMPRFQLIADSDTPVPDGTGTFETIDAPVVSDSAVAFSATGIAQEGVYRWIEGTLVTVADLETSIPGGHGSFSLLSLFDVTPSIDGLGVAFQGFGPGPSPNPYNPIQEGIFYVDECGLNVAVDQNDPNPTDPSYGFFGFLTPRLRDGRIAFWGSGSDPSGVFLWNGAGIQTIADGNTAIPEGSGNFTSLLPPGYDGVNVAFWGGGGEIVGGHRERPGVYVFNGSSLIKAADKNTQIPSGSGDFTSFGLRPVVDDGEVVFTGSGGTVLGVYLYNTSTGVLSSIVDNSTRIPGTATEFWNFMEVSISDGRVAFFGRDMSGMTQGLFLWENGVVRPVFYAGQAIDERVVYVADFAQEGLSGDKLAFVGLYVVSPGPPLVIGDAVYVVHVPLAGDADNDGQVDLEDHAPFADCLSGPGVPPSPTPPTTTEQCLSAFDLELDNDVDLREFRMLQLSFSALRHRTSRVDPEVSSQRTLVVRRRPITRHSTPGRAGDLP